MSKQPKQPAAGQHTTEDQTDLHNISNTEAETQDAEDEDEDDDEEDDEADDNDDDEIIGLPPNGRVNAPIIYQLEFFLDFVHPRRLKSDLINILLQYLVHQADELPENFKETAENFSLLFGWLDFVEKEMDERGFVA